LKKHWECWQVCKSTTEHAEKKGNKEPLMPTHSVLVCHGRDRPRQKLWADLFKLGSKIYRLVVDYASSYVEITQLAPSRPTDVIVHLKSIFTHQGIPETLMTDNGPQFSGMAFAMFVSQGHMASAISQAAQNSHRVTVKPNAQSRS